MTGSADANIGWRRLAAFGVDWLVIAAWGSALFGAVMLGSRGQVSTFQSPGQGQLIGLLTMTLPVTLYFAWLESSGFQASLGKRLLRLRVLADSGERLPFGRSFVRTAVKFLPWECGHAVAHQMMHSTTGAIGPGLWALIAISLVAPMVWILTALVKNRTPYDAWSGATVVSR